MAFRAHRHLTRDYPLAVHGNICGVLFLQIHLTLLLCGKNFPTDYSQHSYMISDMLFFLYLGLSFAFRVTTRIFGKRCFSNFISLIPPQAPLLLLL